MSQVASGTVLAGKYRLESMIGRGGMGSVWRAQHLALSAPVAVKLLTQVDFTKNPEALARFHREAQAAAMIRSPHVVQIFDHGVDEALTLPFIAMELMEGESLADRLMRDRCIDARAVARIFTHVGRALSRAHEAGIVHRDLKPDNVFLVRNEDEEIAKVLDFGIAKSQLSAGAAAGKPGTATGTVMGTAYYMSPEQISGEKVDFRTDIWAFGVMACECLTGRRPFEADSIAALAMRICLGPIPRPSSFASVPAGMDEWFAHAVSHDIAQRFASARDAAEALRVLCMGESVEHRAPTPPAIAVDVPRVALRASTDAPVARSTHEALRVPVSKPNRGVLVAAGALALTALGVLSWFGHWLTAQQSSVALSHSGSATAAVSIAVPTDRAACETGTRECTGATPRACVAGKWLSEPVAAGQCGAECTPESSPSRCEGGIPKTCDASGHWQGNTPCNDAQECAAGVCVTKKPTRSAPSVVAASPVPAAAPARAPSPAATPLPNSVSASKPDCDPSYTLDSQGRKHFKPECFR